MDLWELIVLGIVQGATEFLPVSSDGHLVVAAAILKGGDVESLDVGDVNIVLHLGTLVSILVYYWRRLWRVITEERGVLWLLVVGTIPAVILGVPIKFLFKEILSSVPLTGAMLIFNGLMLLLSAKHVGGKLLHEQLSSLQATIIGAAQASAILPGLSRSCMTITTGMRLGLAPRDAATFSFLLAIPAIGGAGVLEAISMLKDGTPLSTSPVHLILAAAVAGLVGYACLSVLVRVLERGRLHWFAYWCLPLGLLVLVCYYTPVGAALARLLVERGK